MTETEQTLTTEIASEPLPQEPVRPTLDYRTANPKAVETTPLNGLTNLVFNKLINATPGAATPPDLLTSVNRLVTKHAAIIQGGINPLHTYILRRKWEANDQGVTDDSRFGCIGYTCRQKVTAATAFMNYSELTQPDRHHLNQLRPHLGALKQGRLAQVVARVIVDKGLTEIANPGRMSAKQIIERWHQREKQKFSRHHRSCWFTLFNRPRERSTRESVSHSQSSGQGN
jgi:hypothetical protein